MAGKINLEAPEIKPGRTKISLHFIILPPFGFDRGDPFTTVINRNLEGFHAAKIRQVA